MKDKKEIIAMETEAKEEIGSRISEVPFDDLKKVTGAGEWDDVPPVDEHPYDPDTRNKG